MDPDGPDHHFRQIKERRLDMSDMSMAAMPRPNIVVPSSAEAGDQAALVVPVKVRLVAVMAPSLPESGGTGISGGQRADCSDSSLSALAIDSPEC